MNLDELKQTRGRLQGLEVAAALAVQRAEKEGADELFRVRECERPLEAARDRKAYDAAAIVLDSTKKDHALALKRLSDRQAEHAYADMEARTAEAMVVRAVDKILTDEIVERSKRVESLLNEARREGLALKHFAIAAGVHATGIVPPSALRVLDRLNTPLINALEIPINMEKLGDVAAFRDWTARRTELIDGATEPKAA
jgi:hypothetical protein